MKTATIVNAQLGMVPDGVALEIDDDNKIRAIIVGDKRLKYNRSIFYAQPDERKRIQEAACAVLGLKKKETVHGDGEATILP